MRIRRFEEEMEFDRYMRDRAGTEPALAEVTCSPDRAGGFRAWAEAARNCLAGRYRPALVTALAGAGALAVVARGLLHRGGPF